MLKMIAIIAALVPLAACGTTAGGVRGEIAFRATGHLSEYVSLRPPVDIADCFARSAKLLPFSLISTDPVEGTPVYRLRYQDYWFEQITFRRGPEGGTLIEVTSSGNYDRGWTAMLVRDRLGPLGDCMTPAARWTTNPARADQVAAR